MVKQQKPLGIHLWLHTSHTNQNPDFKTAHFPPRALWSSACNVLRQRSRPDLFTVHLHHRTIPHRGGLWKWELSNEHEQSACGRRPELSIRLKSRAQKNDKQPSAKPPFFDGWSNWGSELMQGKWCWHIWWWESGHHVVQLATPANDIMVQVTNTELHILHTLFSPGIKILSKLEIT